MFDMRKTTGTVIFIFWKIEGGVKEKQLLPMTMRKEESERESTNYARNGNDFFFF